LLGLERVRAPLLRVLVALLVLEQLTRQRQQVLVVPAAL
jgi:hypothetical protein